VISEHIQKLRAAATLLRERASKDPAGPWWTERSGEIVVGNGAPFVRCVGVFAFAEDSSFRAGGEDAAMWVAMMSPAVSLPLAHLLESFAAIAEFEIEYGEPGRLGHFHACRVAEALLGSDPPRRAV
jgi:hypothetical protein